MNTTEKVLDKIEIIKTIFFNSNNFYQTWRYLRQLDKIEFKKQIENSLMLRSYDYLLYYSLIIELCKLFEDKENSQKHNFHRFLKKLKNNLLQSDYRNKIDMKYIDNEIEKLNLLFKTITKLSDIRDKYFVHTDKGFIIPLKDFISFKEFDELFDFSRKLIIDLDYKFKNIALDISDIGLKVSTENTLKELVKFYKLKQKPELDLWKYY